MRDRLSTGSGSRFGDASGPVLWVDGIYRSDRDASRAQHMTVLIAGCGDLGTEAGLRFAATGRRVIGLRRSPEVLPDAIEPHQCDLATEVPAVPTDTEIVVIATAADERTAEAYRAAYIDSLTNLLDALHRAGVMPRQVLSISSTAVYDVDDGSWVNEDTPAAPASSTGRVLLEAEHLLHARQPSATVLRLGGIYGPGRTRLIDQVREGTARLSGKLLHTNRIHRDDAAAAIVHLTTAVNAPAPVYLGVDSAPAERNDVLRFLADELAVPHPPTGTSSQNRGGDKRCTNQRLRATGFTFEYPSYREGYRAILAGQGVRHD